MTNTRVLALFICIIVVAVSAQIFFAMNTVYLWDEARDWIPESQKISFDPANLNLPIRTDRKGALFAYLLNFSDVMDARLHLNHRWINILFAAISTGLIALIGQRLSGRAIVGLVAAAIFALNEFTISISATSIQISVYMTLSLAAILAFLVYLDRQSPFALCLTAVFLGLAFLAYEISVLTGVSMGLFLLWRYRLELFRSPHVYGALVLFLIVIAPDIYANTIARGSQTVGYDELSGRVGGLGINPQYGAFFVKDLLDKIYPIMLGRPFKIDGEEYTYVNTVTGVVLLVAFAHALLARVFWLRSGGLRHVEYLLLLFIVVFGAFSVVEVSNVQVAGIPLYVSLTMVPASVFAANLICSGGWIAKGALGATVLGLGIGLFGLLVHNYDRPRAHAVLTPEFLLAPDDAMMTVTVNIDVCDLCPSDFEQILVDAGVLDANDDLVPYSEFENDMEGIELGKPVTKFLLRAKGENLPPEWMARIYRFDYELRSEGEVFAKVSAFTRVPHNKVDFQPWPPLFWLK